MKISALITALQQIHQEHSDLSFADEKPLASMAVRYVEVRQIPDGRAYRYVPTVVDGELVMTIRAQ